MIGSTLDEARPLFSSMKLGMNVTGFFNMVALFLRSQAIEISLGRHAYGVEGCTCCCSVERIP
jgi:hypothetical protein